MRRIQIQFSPFSRLFKMIQVLTISKVKCLFRFFLLRLLNTDVVMKFINNLNVVRSCQMNYIPTKVIKMNKGIFANFTIMGHFNYCIAYSKFPHELKHSDVITIHKKNEKCERPVSNLISIPKIYKKLIYN